MDQPDDTSDHPLSFDGLSEFLEVPGESESPVLAAGTRVGDVTLGHLLGEGGMGRVYEGYQDSPQRTVAVKLVRSGILSASAAKRFHLEAQILGRLSHPGIARIYSAGIETRAGGPVPYFVMELVDAARPLTTFAFERNLTTRERVTLFQQVAAAIAHGHQRGIVHRDLKPSNILVDSTGQPKIIDFGVARSTDGDVALTTMHTDVGQLVGTLQYMSPEQFSGNVDELDLRADVYSLGVVLYELLTGSLPYNIQNRPLHEAARVVIETDPPFLSSVNSRLRGDLTTIVATCLDKDRSRRYSTASELAADLGRYLRGDAITASPPRLVDTLSRLIRRHRLAAAATLAVATALVLGTLGTTLYAVRAEHQRRLAVAAQYEADAATLAAKQQLYRANLQAMQGSLATGNMRRGRQAALENEPLAGSPPPLETRCLTAAFDASLAAFDVGNGAVIDLAWSPTDNQLAVWKNAEIISDNAEAVRVLALPTEQARANQGELILFDTSHFPWQQNPIPPDPPLWLRRWQANRGDRTGLANLVEHAHPVVAISPDGEQLATQLTDGRVQVLSRSTLAAGAVLADYRGLLQTARFLRGQNRLFLINAAGQIGLWDTVSGARLQHTQNGSVQQFTVSADGSHFATISRQSDGDWSATVFAASDGRVCLTTPAMPSGTGTASPLALSPDGSLLALGSGESAISLLDTSTGVVATKLDGHDAIVTALAFGEAGAVLASGATNGSLRLWDVPTGRCRQTLIGHEGYIHSLAFAADGRQLASGSADGTVRLWKSDQPATLGLIPSHGEPIHVSLSPDSRLVAIATSDAIELWNANTVEPVQRLPALPGTPVTTAFSPNSRLLAAVSQPGAAAGRLSVWDLASREFVLQADLEPDAWTVTFSPTSDQLVTTSSHQVAASWALPSGNQLFTITTRRASRTQPVAGVFGLAGSRLAFPAQTLVDATTGRGVIDLAPQGQVTALTVSNDGTLLGSGLAIGRILVSNFQTGQRISRGIGHAGNVLTLAFSPDGHLIASGGEDGTVQLHEVASGESVRVFVGHEGRVAKVLFTPDGQRLVSSSTDGTVRIWDVARGDELLALPGSQRHPAAVMLASQGEHLLTITPSGSGHEQVRIWGLSNADVFRARQREKVAESSDTALPTSPEKQPDQPVPAESN